MGSFGAGMMGGQLFGQILGMAGDAVATAVQVRETEKARDAAEKIYNSRYQRTVRDMRLAGLNPILASTYGGGSGPVLGGAQARVGTPRMDVAGAAAHSAQAEKSKQDVALSKEQMKRERASRLMMNSQSDYYKALANNEFNRSESVINSAYQSRLQTQLMRAGMPSALHQADVAKSDFGRAMDWVNKASSAMGLANFIKGGLQGEFYRRTYNKTQSDRTNAIREGNRMRRRR